MYHPELICAFSHSTALSSHSSSSAHAPYPPPKHTKLPLCIFTAPTQLLFSSHAALKLQLCHLGSTQWLLPIHCKFKFEWVLLILPRTYVHCSTLMWSRWDYASKTQERMKSGHQSGTSCAAQLKGELYKDLMISIMGTGPGNVHTSWVRGWYMLPRVDSNL